MQSFLSAAQIANSSSLGTLTLSTQIDALLAKALLHPLRISQHNPNVLTLRYLPSAIALSSNEKEITLPKSNNQQFFVATLSDSTEPKPHHYALMLLTKHSVSVSLANPTEDSLLNKLKLLGTSVNKVVKQNVELDLLVKKSTPRALTVVFPASPSKSFDIPLDNPQTRPLSGQKIRVNLHIDANHIQIYWANKNTSETHNTAIATVSPRSYAKEQLLLYALRQNGLSFIAHPVANNNGNSEQVSFIKLGNNTLTAEQLQALPVVHFEGQKSDAFEKVRPLFLEKKNIPLLFNMLDNEKLQRLIKDTPSAQIKNIAEQAPLQTIAAQGNVHKNAIKTLSEHHKAIIAEAIKPLLRQSVAHQAEHLSIDTLLSSFTNWENAAKDTVNPSALKHALQIKQFLEKFLLPTQNKDNSAGLHKGAGEALPTDKHIATALQNMTPDAMSSLQEMKQDLKNVMNAPAIPITQTMLHAAPTSLANNNFVASLVSLLTIALSARAKRELAKSSLGDQNEPIKNKSSTARQKAEANSQVNENSLLRQLVGILSSHQTSKLRHADSALSGQEQLHYILPAPAGGSSPIELLIKKEFAEKERPSNNEGKMSVWHLTMRLAVGDIGEMMAKVRYGENDLNLKLYSSNHTLLSKIEKSLPYLISKLEASGIAVTTAQARCAQIPATLADKTINLLETSA